MDLNSINYYRVPQNSRKINWIKLKHKHPIMKKKKSKNQILLFKKETLIKLLFKKINNKNWLLKKIWKLQLNLFKKIFWVILHKNLWLKSCKKVLMPFINLKMMRLQLLIKYWKIFLKMKFFSFYKNVLIKNRKRSKNRLIN